MKTRHFFAKSLRSFLRCEAGLTATLASISRLMNLAWRGMGWRHNIPTLEPYVLGKHGSGLVGL